MAKPKRGEVWLVDMGYAAKVRPALVLSGPVLDDERVLQRSFLIQQAYEERGLRFRRVLGG